MTTETSPPAAIIKIKTEDQGNEIKNFAETAMNELLGWYGYEEMERLDLSSKAAVISPDISVKSGLSCNSIKNREDFTSSNHDSSRENSNSPCSVKNIIAKKDVCCGWCRKEVAENSPDFLASVDGPRYCSESCFTQSRRASFKKAKTCDWCRHVRHAVSYVDFQDGACQLQFCSDKCLNQYKMQIFCKETQAHLDMNPHLKEKGIDNSSGLITPELWLRNCRSRSISPVSELSKSRSPTPPSKQHASTPEQQQQQSNKPIISVAPASKLMLKNSNNLIVHHLTKHARKRKTYRNSNSQMNNNDNENKSFSVVLNLASSGKNIKPHRLTEKLNCNSSAPTRNSSTNVHHVSFNEPLNSTNEVSFKTSSTSAPEISQSIFLNNQQSAHQTRLPSSSHHPSPPHPQLSTLSSYSSLADERMCPIQSTSLVAPVPPVTIMVPYPIIIPLPIPIPIPLPVINFVNLLKEKHNNVSENNDLISSKINQESNSNEPLDFTKSKISPRIDDGNLNKNLTPEVSFSGSNDYDSLSTDSDNEGSNIANSKLNYSKVKLTRLHAKRLITKESEKSRPLRKRKRIIDYLRCSKEDGNNQQK